MGVFEVGVFSGLGVGFPVVVEFLGGVWVWGCLGFGCGVCVWLGCGG